ncbi:MAG: ferredoxin [Candidatus Omnitrophica bacterium]|nr:ferredoxin [Candidatus Omnitrophota bacterium]
MMRKSKDVEKSSLKQISGFMATAARTAPKAKGVDNILTLIVEKGKEKNLLIKEMLRIAKSENKPNFERDAANIKNSPVVVIIGTRTEPIGLTYCGFCGFADCEALSKAKGVCAYNCMDLGIAVGSAVDIASNFHVDNRIMYSVGKAAININLFKNKQVNVAVAIPLSASGKNIFFDRK